jgi:hypothetical protein
MGKKEKKSSWWIWVIIILLALYFYGNYREKWEEENCELTFNTYTYNDGCASACSSKCFNEGFPHTDAGFFEPYLSYEEMTNDTLYKRCVCNCGGCRE